MTYTFDILGIAPLLTVFEYQQRVAQNPHHSKAYLGSPECTLDGLIKSTDLLVPKPNWNWDEVIQRMVNFWLKHEERIHYWQGQLATVGQDNVLVARVANVEMLRNEFELLLE
ncbi:MAG: hypothetical protein F6J87_10090 [Spirulina sp. SIO3F2]|nr:hypothetical protein [Spirulina sp. SIO3F2]